MKDHIKLWETWRNISLESNVKNIQWPNWYCLQLWRKLQKLWYIWRDNH